MTDTWMPGSRTYAKNNFLFIICDRAYKRQGSICKGNCSIHGLSLSLHEEAA